MKKTGAFFASVLVFGMFLAAGAEAAQFRLGHKYDAAVGEQIIEVQNYNDSSAAISPSQAASIAKRSWPGAKVLRVQLLPSGVYAVTLKQGGQVSRVMVDASSGELV